MRLIDIEPCEKNGAGFLQYVTEEGTVVLTLTSFIPTIDAVPVVRCRDCVNSMLWRKPCENVVGECFIRRINSEDDQFCLVGADDFCSYGERKDGEW